LSVPDDRRDAIVAAIVDATAGAARILAVIARRVECWYDDPAMNHMQNRLKDKRVLITGASAGFGEACARALRGLRGTARTLGPPHGPARKLKAEIEDRYHVTAGIRCVDVRDREAVRAAAADLVARGCLPTSWSTNAGLASGLDPIHEGHYEDWDAMIDTNLKVF